MEQIQILEAKIKALEDLVSIQNEIITTLKNRPAQIQYVPYYQQPYYWPYYHYQYPWSQYYQGAQSIGGAQNGNWHQQMQGTGGYQAQQGGTQGQYYAGSQQGQLTGMGFASQGSLSLAK